MDPTETQVSDTVVNLIDKPTDETTLEHNQNDDDHIRIPIVGFETMEERARFTVFKLRVENVKLEENWLVFRRYTDFVRLHSKLKDEFPTISIPLPPKRWLRDNFETVFLEDRMKGLQAFVDSILIQPTLTDNPLVREFFCMDEPPMYPDNAEESRSLFGTLEESMVMLKHQLSEKDAEIELLKTELALLSTQRDNILKITRTCRNCSQRNSVSSPPSHSKFSSPVASSSPTSRSPRTSSIGNGSSAHNSVSGTNRISKTNGTAVGENVLKSSTMSPTMNKIKSKSSSIDVKQQSTTIDLQQEEVNALGNNIL